MASVTAHRDPRAHRTGPTATSPFSRVTGVSRPQNRSSPRPVWRLDALEIELLFEIIEWLDVKDAVRLRLVSTDTIHLSTITHQLPIRSVVILLRSPTWPRVFGGATCAR
jgi:hypothetical protein